MANVLDNALWYRVADLRPSLHGYVRITQQSLRGQETYVLHDPKTGRNHRFSARANNIIGRLDGIQTIQDIWNDLEKQGITESLSQEQVIQVLMQLNEADLLQIPQSENAASIVRKGQQRKAKLRKSRFTNPMAVRFPLLDPDKFLVATLPYVRWLFGWSGFALWCLAVLSALLLASMHWSELTENVADRVLTPGNMLIIGLIYPVIKALHELGHGYAARIKGGEVHEMGLMLLVFMPVPYVDGSAAASFPNPRHRMFVGAAGIFVEAFVAALAMFIWVLAEPGLVRAIAFNVMLIGAVSTVVVNGNPLLKFDGYYILTDFLQIPNLAKRSNQYVGYLFRRFVLAISDARSPARNNQEARILTTYSVSSFFYRLLIMYTIVLYVSDRFFIVGILLAVFAVIMQLALPSAKALNSLLASSEFRDSENASARRLMGVFGCTALVLFVLPMPLTTKVEGVVWLPPESEVRSGADAVITEIVAEPGKQVSEGDLLIRLEDPEIVAQVKILEAELKEAEARYLSVQSLDPVEGQIIEQEITRIKTDLRIANTRLDSLTLYSKRDGEFLINDAENVIGRFVRNGALIAFVADSSHNTVIAAVSQDEIGLIRSRRGEIELRLAESMGEAIEASVVRETPAARNQLPSAALGSNGGGRFATNPSDENGLETLEDVFQLELSATQPVQRFGERAYVRFEHGYEPLALQWYRSLRQVFLSQLDA